MEAREELVCELERRRIADIYAQALETHMRRIRGMVRREFVRAATPPALADVDAALSEMHSDLLSSLRLGRRA